MDVRMPRSHGCERAAMSPTVTVATVTILTTIELFIWLKAFAPLRARGALGSSYKTKSVDQILVLRLSHRSPVCT
jgi:hypothetical protein